MADKKPFNFEDWMKMRKTQLPSIASKYRKKFDLTPNTWMEDPEIWNRVKKASQLDKSFAKDLALNADNPAFTKQFISKLDELVPQVPFEEATQVARAETATDLGNVLKNRAYSLEKSPLPEQLVSEARPVAPVKIAKASGLHLSEPLYSELLKDELANIEKSVGKDRVVENLMRSSMQSEPSKFGKYAETEKGILEKSRQYEEAQAAKKAAEEAEMARKAAEEAKAAKAAEEAAEAARATQAAKEAEEAAKAARMAKLNEGFSEAVKAKDVSKLQQFRDILKKVATPIEKVLDTAPGRFMTTGLGGKVLGGAGGVLALSEAKEELKRQEYLKALADATAGVGGIMSMFPHPATKLIGTGMAVGGGAMRAGLGASDMLGLNEEEKERTPSFVNPELDSAELDKKLKEFEQTKEFTPSGSPIPSPAPTPTPSPTPEEAPTASIGSKMMDMFGIPSASAEEMDRAPASTKKMMDMPLGKTVKASELKGGPTIDFSKNSSSMDDLPMPELQLEPEVKAPAVEKPTPVAQPTPVEAPSVEAPADEATPVETKPEEKPSDEEKKIEYKPRQYEPNTIRNAVYISAVKSGIPAPLALAIADKESDFNLSNPKVFYNPDETGSARSLFQIRGETFNDLKKRVNPQYLKNLVHEDLSSYANIDKAIQTGLDVIKLKAKDHNLDINDPKNWFKLAEKYYGNKDPSLNRQYANSVLDRARMYDEYLNRRVNKLGQKINPFPNSEQYAEVRDSSFELPPSEFKNIPVDQLTQEVETEGEGEPSSVKSAADLFKAIQDESSGDREAKLIAMRNLLNTQSASTMAKGLALMASGVVGAKKNFVTVPELKGMEAFDTMDRAPATALAMQEKIEKDRYDDPNSGVSKAYRNYASEVLRKLDDKFNPASLEGLSANSIKALLPMGIKEDSLLYRKLKDISSRSDKDVKIDQAFITKNLKPANDTILGTKGGRGKDLMDLKRKNDIFLFSSLGLPRDITLKEFEANKSKYIRDFDQLPDKIVADATQAINALVTGKGAPTQNLFKELKPATARSFIQSLQGWAMGGPKPAKLGEFMALFTEIALKGRSIVEQERQQLANSVMAPIGESLKQNPNLTSSKAYYDAMVREHDIDTPEDMENIQRLLKRPEFSGDYAAARTMYHTYKKSKEQRQ